MTYVGLDSMSLAELRGVARGWRLPVAESFDREVLTEAIRTASKNLSE